MYIITKSDDYYPSTGCNDWVKTFVGYTFADVKVWLDGYITGLDDMCSVSVIELFTDGTFKEVFYQKVKYK